MEGVSGRRERKPVNYAEIAEFAADDNDFDDFKSSPTCKTENVKDSKEKVDGEQHKDDRERKHSKDRHRNHKKHKDKDKDRNREEKDRHKRDRDKHREDRGRHRKRDDREKDERKRRDQRDREHRSERRDNNCSEDSSKGEGSSDSTYDPSGNQTCHNLPPIPASPLVSPSRRNPKPRLTREEKIFQRELEVALEMSKEESSQAPSKAPEPEEHEVAEAGTAVEERQEIHPPSSPKPLPEQSDGSGCSPIIGSIGAPVRASSLALEKPSIALSEEEEAAEHTPDPTPPLAVADCTETKQPMPSTSAGKTAKRIRKTVMFKEDSDSDDFDGFACDSAGSDTSQGSDFIPSPKKKKKAKDSKKTKNTRPSRNSTRKSSSISTGQNKAGDVVFSPKSHPLIAKENTAPKDSATSPPKGKLASPKVTTSPELKTSSSLHTPPPVKTVTKKTSVAKPVKRPLVSSSSSPSSGAPSISLVKTPFRNPLSTSPNSGYSVGSPTTSMGTKILNRGTGLRLGLSRRAIVKPLHPSAASRITN